MTSKIKLDWKSKIIFSPEDATLFNSSRLLLFFDVLHQLKLKQGIDLERLCYFDFFAANPYLVVAEGDPLRLDFEINGFEPNKLEYASSSQRFNTKRESIKQYLSLLLCKGLICVKNEDAKLLYEITQHGIDAASQINSMYAIAYRKSAFCIIEKLKDYSDQKLWESASKWLESKSFRVDLFDMVEEV